MKVLLNRFSNPRLSDQIFVGKGDKVFASRSAEEYGFTLGKEYVVEDVSPFGYIAMKNDKGEIDEYTVEHFQKHKPVCVN